MAQNLYNQPVHEPKQIIKITNLFWIQCYLLEFIWDLFKLHWQ